MTTILWYFIRVYTVYKDKTNLLDKNALLIFNQLKYRKNYEGKSIFYGTDQGTTSIRYFMAFLIEWRIYKLVCII